MLAQNNDYIKEAADTVFRLCQDERVRMECEAREDHYRTQLGIQRMIERQAAALEAQTAKIQAQASSLEAQDAKIQSPSSSLESQTAQIQAQASSLEAQDAKIQAQINEIKLQAAEIDKLQTWIKAHGYDPADI